MCSPPLVGWVWKLLHGAIAAQAPCQYEHLSRKSDDAKGAALRTTSLPSKVPTFNAYFDV